MPTIIKQQTLISNPPITHHSNCISARRYHLLSNMKIIFHILILRHLASYCGKIFSKEICIIGACKHLFRNDPYNQIKCTVTRSDPQHFYHWVGSKSDKCHKTNKNYKSYYLTNTWYIIRHCCAHLQ